ncbi:transposase [Faecalibacillus faecis]|uniref:transposase n=1 Tax=Faecalibacillus faecis TaxID=1982628 RepID=UPI00386BF018
MKLSLEDKVEIVRLHEKDGLGYGSIARKYKVRDSVIQSIYYRYKIHGYKSLIHPPKRKKYSAEFKMKIIKQVYEGKSKTSLAAEYNLPGAGTIVTWIHKYEELGYNGLMSKQGRPKKNMNPEKEEKTNIVNSSPLTDKEREEFEELKRQYDILKKEKELSDMENEFLKKLDALVQERLKRERKK